MNLPERAGKVLRYTVGGLALPLTGGGADDYMDGASYILPRSHQLCRSDCSDLQKEMTAPSQGSVIFF